jgi:hypothetical protein
MFGWFKLPTPQERLIDIQAQIDAVEGVINLTGTVSIRDRVQLKELYYERNKIKASTNG